jgi:hypothetical protein
MSKSPGLASLYALIVGLVSGCAVWSPVTVVTDRPVLELDTVSFQASDGLNEVVFLRRDPVDGGELIVSGVPLEQRETLYGTEKEPGKTNATSILRGMEYCKLTADQKRNGQVASATTAEGATPNSQGDVQSRPTTIAGRVVSVDDHCIILEEAIMIDESARVVTGAPIHSKIPRVSRLFKNTGSMVEPKSIPGQITIPLREVQQVESIAASSWPSVRQAGFQRIGIDFDFNIPSKP